MEQVKIQCCLCGTLTLYNQSKMCMNCLQIRANITEAIEKDLHLQVCRYCERYNRPPWLPGKLESAELLNICLTKIKGISRFKIVDSNFVYTEPHSKRIHIKIKVRKEVEGVMIEQECLVKFVVQDTQCDDCKKTFTPHTWNTKVQVRQKVEHMRTLYYLEQMIIKHKANIEFMAVKQKINGFDVHFLQKSYAKKFVDFLHTQVPCLAKESKQLISSDFKSNTYNYKYTYAADIVPICKDDLVVLDQSHRIPGLGLVLLCVKVTTQVHLIDIVSFQTTEINATRYWKSPFESYASKSRLVEFIVLDIEATDNGKYEIQVARSNDERFGEITYFVKSHIGKGINCGDSVLGYDLVTIVPHHWNESISQKCPDVILVHRVHQKKKSFKRLNGIDDAETSESDEENENEEEEKKNKVEERKNEVKERENEVEERKNEEEMDGEKIDEEKNNEE